MKGLHRLGREAQQHEPLARVGLLDAQPLGDRLLSQPELEEPP
jgi:hypothetical protein